MLEAAVMAVPETTVELMNVKHSAAKEKKIYNNFMHAYMY
jgi:hypothetical protein